jgi:hypothetical protein
MNTNHILKIASEFDFDESRVQAVATLLEQDSTIPFIARYRKEATGSLDEVQITGIRDRLKQLEELDTRKDAVLKSLEHHGHLTNDLKETVLAAQTWQFWKTFTCRINQSDVPGRLSRGKKDSKSSPASFLNKRESIRLKPQGLFLIKKKGFMQSMTHSPGQGHYGGNDQRRSQSPCNAP